MKSCFGESSQTHTKYAIFPFKDKEYWERICTYLCAVEEWSVSTLVKNVDLIGTAQQAAPYKLKVEQRYGKLLKLLGDEKEHEGEEGILWGGVQFQGQDSNFEKVVYWFMRYTLPHIVALVLEATSVFPDTVPLLTSASTLIFSRKQCAALLAMSFFSLWQESSQPQPEEEFHSPVDFLQWFQFPKGSSKAKLFMLMHYFERSRVGLPDGNVELHRLEGCPAKSLAAWVSNQSKLCGFQVHEEGGITSSCGPDTLLVDFANKYIGGGVLNLGAVQEEIMFVEAPELLVSLMFCSALRDNEALVMVNAQRVAVTTGYNTSLKFASNYTVNEQGICRVAIDATCYGWGGTNRNEQWTQRHILRELNKAFVGFNHAHPIEGAPIGTGNWGCGAFGGCIQLKALLQWCAASACNRDAKYFTFGDSNAEGLGEVTQIIQDNLLAVGTLLQLILKYSEAKLSGDVAVLDNVAFERLPSLFKFIKVSLST